MHLMRGSTVFYAIWIFRRRCLTLPLLECAAGMAGVSASVRLALEVTMDM